MTDNQNPPELDASSFWQEPDFILTDLVSLMANKMNSELGITLLVGGTVMTGTLVGERDYLSTVSKLFKSVAREMFDHPTRDDLKAIDDAFEFDAFIEDEYLEPDDAPVEEDAPDEAVPMPPIRFLHLKDPLIIAPGSTMSFRESALPIMRIRLSQIQGWMMGRVTMMNTDEFDEFDDEPPSNGSSFPRGGFIQ
ncbi:MAG: hypothetical protein KME04_05635 [Pleurocapsa minor GSE-CHR-MK-17-07R]|jgi:hypothetical protein|nr:hypothetical protein [Pleurocapsa minor GSE-CHR-MK 17-07R]